MLLLYHASVSTCLSWRCFSGFYVRSCTMSGRVSSLGTMRVAKDTGSTQHVSQDVSLTRVTCNNYTLT